MSGQEPSAVAAPEERFQLAVIAMVLTAMVGVGAMWHAVLSMLVNVAVLAPAGHQILVQVPQGGGVGLDSPRCWIGAAVVMTVLWGSLRRQILLRRFTDQ